MAKKFRTDEIPSGNYTEDWGGSVNNTTPKESDETNTLPYSGEAVQKFVKDSLQRCEAKIGYFTWSSAVDSSNYYHLYGFADKASYEEWKSGDQTDPTISALLLLDETLPISTIQGDSYGAYLYGNISASANIVVTGTKLEVPLRFCAVRTSSGDRLNMGSKGTLVVQRKTTTSSWTTVGTITDALNSSDYTATESWSSVDIGSYLLNGTQEIRVQARFEYEDGEGKTQTQSSMYVAIGSSVVKTSLSLTCSQDYQTPIYASIQQNTGFPYSYTVYGACEKTLHIEITGGNSSVLQINKLLTKTQNGTTIRESYSDGSDAYKLFKHGVRKVRAWLTAEDGLGNTLKSNELVNRFMVVNTTTEGADLTKPYLLIQNMASKAENYTQTTLCDYAVYSPVADEDGNISNNGDSVKVIFYLTSYGETFPSDSVTNYYRMELGVEPGTTNTLTTTVEIEREDDTDEITGYFRVYRRDPETDNEVEFLTDALGTDIYVVTVDNSGGYAPTKGATFLMNPKTRNNTESNPMRIINSKNGNAEVESTWSGFGLVNDGWVTADDGIKVLRIPAGAKLTMKYNPWAQFLTSANSSMTLELDFAVRNVTNEADPIIQICEAVSGGYLGLRMKPLEGCMYPASKLVDSETDFQWQEDKRTHIVINIHNAVVPDKGDALKPSDGTNLDVTATSIPLIRVFINGDIEREVRFSTSNREEFCTAAMSNGGIVLGQDGADLDIYGIRCYTNLKLESSDIVKDYISTLPTAAEKERVRKENDIMTGELVDVEKVKALGKRTLILHGSENYFYNTGSQKIWWEIFQYNADGTYNPALSGTICKETKTKSKRQGSTANTYYYSNIQTKISDGGDITVPLSDIHESITWVLNDPVTNEETGEVTQTVSIYGGNLGAKDPVENSAKEYPYSEVDGVPSVTVPDGWIDGNGKYRGCGFMITEGTPLGDKLVLKVNYASSMQSHLAGCTKLYSDLHTAVVGKNSLQEACEKNGNPARVAKFNEPVFFFTQADDSGDVVFRGGGTFGPGKMDKPTWGYNKKVKTQAMFAMFEGSDNNYDLTDMRVPFTTDTNCAEAITYSPDDEGYFYNGLQNLDFDGGKTDEDANGNEYPIADLTNRLAEIWNFLYLHSPMITYYNGTFANFMLSTEAGQTTKKFWCTEGSEAFKLKRYNFVNGTWVDAGLWDSTTQTYGVVNLKTDEMTKDVYEASENKALYAKLNAELKGAIVSHAKKYIEWYVNTKSLRFHYAFINHFMAGTDNCSKNTYYVFDPVAKDVTIDGVTKSCVLMELHQDDVDTILPIDNNGRKTKPYYIDRMHPFADTDTTQSNSCYEGMNNVLFNLCEEMYEGTKELQSTMKSILTEMTMLVSETDDLVGFTGSNKVSVFGCIWKYMFNIQTFFSATAYNEQARIRYEYPAMLNYISQGSGARGIAPITQSCGSLLEAEVQFVRRRLIYMASYAAWGNFYDGSKSYSVGMSDAADSFSMQVYHLPDSATSASEYKFTVKPHQYIYPTGMLGQTSVDPHVRVAPDEEYTLVLGTTTSNDTGLSVLGINYYHSIGNIGDLSTSPNMSVTINGKRLTEIVAVPTKLYVDLETGESVPAYRPKSLTITATKVKSIDIHGCVGIQGRLDLTELSRLETVNISDTSISDVALPESEILTTVNLPATLTRLTLSNMPNLTKVTMGGVSKINSLIIGENIPVSKTVFELCYTDSAPIRTLKLSSISWTGVSLAQMRYMAGLDDCEVTGSIAMIDNVANSPAWSDKLAWMDKWDAIDDSSNTLYITYYGVAANSISINGDASTPKAGVYTYYCVPDKLTANDVKSISWDLDVNMYSTLGSQEKNACDLNVAKVGDENDTAPTTILHCSITKTNGTVLTATLNIKLYERTVKLGDYVYADGSYSDELLDGKTVVGVCFYINPTDASDRRMVALGEIDKTGAWGLQSGELTTLNDNPDYSAWEIASLKNAYGSGFKDDKGISAEGYLDENSFDGFYHTASFLVIDRGIASPGTDNNGKEALSEDLASLTPTRKANEEVPLGLANTLKIIQHRNIILSDSAVNLPIPAASGTITERVVLDGYIDKVISDNNDDYRYSRFYYMQASRCYAYEPTVKANEELNPAFKAHNWYLPAIGELVRIYWHTVKGGDYDGNPTIGNIFKKATDAGVFKFTGNSWYWSSTQVDTQYAYMVMGGSDNRVSGYQKGGYNNAIACASF